jgi:ParB family chromosome partitioning protein
VRKNLLTAVTTPETSKAAAEARSDYARRGASRSMMMSIEEMAENTKKMTAGVAVIELDPHELDGSFVSDRLSESEDDYAILMEAIKAHGQSSPILVRPHPQTPGRYMIVYGHRRTKVARELGIPVRAVVRNIEDIGHIILQGQENTARANLSFIEKSLFAKKLLDMGQSKDTIKAALSVDDSLLSRMLSIAETVPSEVVEAIGAARSVGRDRWEELKRLLQQPGKIAEAAKIVHSSNFQEIDEPSRFTLLLNGLKAAVSPKRKRQQKLPAKMTWASADKSVVADCCVTGKSFTLALKSTEASEFGRYLSTNLEALYRDFKQAKTSNVTGD